MMKLLTKLKDFIDGTLDYENPSAGCCKSICALPGVKKEYKRLNEQDR